MTDRTIYLVRHAEPKHKDEVRRYVGQTDLDLSPRGVRQAEGLARVLRGRGITAIFCSDLIRSVRTASIIGDQLDRRPVQIRELREISLGQWEGRSIDEIKSAFPEEYDQRGRDIANHRPPGGESFADLAQRVVPTFYKVVDSTSGNIVIVGHAGVNRVIISHLLQRPLGSLFEIKQEYACVNTIARTPEGYTVQSIGEDLGGEES